MTTQDTEFEKWFDSAKQDGTYHTARAAFRAGRMVQREKDAEICENWNNDYMPILENAAKLIREQEI